MRDFIILSIETHLFFARIMKEHSLFLEAGFPCCETNWIQEAEFFRRSFEELLQDTLEIADGSLREPILDSNELVTEFTIPAERRTEALSGIPINSNLSQMVCSLRFCRPCQESYALNRRVMQINSRAFKLLNGLIRLKERIFFRVREGRLFTTNYPLLIEHILREAKLYRELVGQLMSNRRISYQNFCETEMFWDQIMMEHAWFIRGLLDPSEAQLLETADQFSKDYALLLEKSRQQDSRASALTEETLEETRKYRDFKTAGAEGILDGQIASIILPLLADHVLREANHFLRILETGQTC